MLSYYARSLPLKELWKFFQLNGVEQLKALDGDDDDLQEAGRRLSDMRQGNVRSATIWQSADVLLRPSSAIVQNRRSADGGKRQKLNIVSILHQKLSTVIKLVT